MSIKDRGFASMNKDRQREIASKGGKIAHAKGVAHEWTSEEARKIGQLGGFATARKRRERKAAKQAALGGLSLD